MISVASYLKTIASFQVNDTAEAHHWAAQINSRYGVNLEWDGGTHDVGDLAKEIYRILKPIPAGLVRGCGIHTLILKSDMGPNKPYYPNHGFFIDHTVALNTDMFYHPDQPDEFMDHRGYFLTRGQQTLYHEWGHGYDAYHEDLSLNPTWTSLSGWSETEKPGLKRLIINDPGAPKVIGEWFFDPKAGFTRFYGKRNPWDDWADCFSFYVAGLRHNVPAEKNGYFDGLLQKYYV